jgi:predicted transglutaminase-like cysteine proteinase
MKYGCVSAALAVSLFGVVSHCEAQEVAALEPMTRAPQYMRVFGNAQPPYGFVRFCEAQPKECVSTATDDQRLLATPVRLSELDEINRRVNHEIEPATDMEIYGVNELWTIPTTRGDCEDFALLKRQELMKRGWPSNSLLMTVVRDEKNEGHAVLTARLSTGDYVLDNKVEQVKMWNQTPYHYVMRQSYLDPKVWVSLDATDGSSPAAIAGVQANK